MHRLTRSFNAVAVVIAVGALTAASLAGQAPARAAGKNAAPRTSDGKPDLQGVWDFRTITSMERPKELAGKDVLTDQEAAKWEREH